MNSNTLRNQLIDRTERLIDIVEEFKKKSISDLNKRPNPESWSALECVEHLNLYCEFYIPAIKKSIKNSNTKPSDVFESGWLGSYFTKSMLPKKKLNKMKTFKDKNPKGTQLDKSTLDKFLHYQNEILNLIEESKKVDLKKTKTEMSLTRFLKFRLGDTFLFNLAHNERHLQQAENALK